MYSRILHEQLKKIKTIVTALLAILVLLSSISQAISIHLCEGNPQAMALIGQAKSCSQATIPCEHTGSFLDVKSCCQDITISVFHAEAYSVSDHVKLGSLQTALLPTNPSRFLNDSDYQITKSYVGYKSPIIERDITTLVHKFLI